LAGLDSRPICDTSDLRRREFQEALLDAQYFEDMPGRWQAAILKAERDRPRLRLVSHDGPDAAGGRET
jgi:hypothetical protein